MWHRKHGESSSSSNYALHDWFTVHYVQLAGFYTQASFVRRGQGRTAEAENDNNSKIGLSRNGRYQLFNSLRRTSSASKTSMTSSSRINKINVDDGSGGGGDRASDSLQGQKHQSTERLPMARDGYTGVAKQIIGFQEQIRK